MTANALPKVLACAVVLALAPVGAARGDEFELSKSDAQLIGKAITNHAHPTGDNPAYLKHTISKDKANRYTISMKTEYYGAFTGKRYVAEIEIKIDTDTGGKGGFEILD